MRINSFKIGDLVMLRNDQVVKPLIRKQVKVSLIDCVSFSPCGIFLGYDTGVVINVLPTQYCLLVLCRQQLGLISEFYMQKC